MLIVSSLWACKTSKTKMIEKNQTVPVAAVQKAIIYKTYKDFSQQVPIIMNETKTQIVSYPAPSDLQHEGRLALPTPLKDGYLLDNRGIGANVVFTKYTYKEYAELENAPSLSELMASIIEKHPLVVLYDCGTRNQYSSISELNKLIEDGFPGCQKAMIKSMQVELKL